MGAPTIRYESTNCFTSFITWPFELGLRHFELAACDGSQDTLLHLAKERVIYRPYERDGDYKLLTTKDQIYHFVLGALETVGYLFIIIPFITALVDCCVNIRRCIPKGCPEFQTHVKEGGLFGNTRAANWRTSPFDSNFDSSKAPNAFYQGASWLPANTTCC